MTRDQFVGAAATAIVALITVGLSNIGKTYFSGNILGFIGLCLLIVLGAYGGAACYYWCRNTISRRKPPYR